MTKNIPYGTIRNFIEHGTTRHLLGEYDKDWWDEDLHLIETPYNMREMIVYVGTGNFRRKVWLIYFQNMFSAIEQKQRHKIRFKLRERV